MGWHSNREFFVSWEELHRATRELARRQLPAEQYKGIIAVSRGGLVPAAIVARELNIRVVDCVAVSSYDHDEQRDDLQLLKDVTATGDGDRLPKAKFVTVYAKPAGMDLVDDFVADLEQDTWIHFPWDMHLHYVEPLAGQEP